MTFDEYTKPIKVDFGKKMENNTLSFMELQLFLLISINENLKELKSIIQEFKRKGE